MCLLVIMFNITKLTVLSIIFFPQDCQPDKICIDTPNGPECVFPKSN